MDIYDAARVVARWWFVTLPVLLLAAIVAGAFTTNLQPEYVAQTEVLLAGPTTREVDDPFRSSEPINPLVEQASALTSSALVASLAVTTAEVGRLLAEDNLSTTYEVETEGRAPILVIRTRAESRHLATATALRVVGLIEEHIEFRQEDAEISADQRVTVTVLGTRSIGGADFGGRSRSKFLIMGLGAGLSLISAFVLDAVTRRSGRPERADQDEHASHDAAYSRS